MIGNMTEWVQDIYKMRLGLLPQVDPVNLVGDVSEESRVYRGACIRSAYRQGLTSGRELSGCRLGFRIVRTSKP